MAGGPGLTGGFSLAISEVFGGSLSGASVLISARGVFGALTWGDGAVGRLTGSSTRLGGAILCPGWLGRLGAWGIFSGIGAATAGVGFAASGVGAVVFGAGVAAYGVDGVSRGGRSALGFAGSGVIITTLGGRAY